MSCTAIRFSLGAAAVTFLFLLLNTSYAWLLMMGLLLPTGLAAGLYARYLSRKSLFTSHQDGMPAAILTRHLERLTKSYIKGFFSVLFLYPLQYFFYLVFYIVHTFYFLHTDLIFVDPVVLLVIPMILAALEVLLFMFSQPSRARSIKRKGRRKRNGSKSDKYMYDTLRTAGAYTADDSPTTDNENNTHHGKKSRLSAQQANAHTPSTRESLQNMHIDERIAYALGLATSQGILLMVMLVMPLNRRRASPSYHGDDNGDGDSDGDSDGDGDGGIHVNYGSNDAAAAMGGHSGVGNEPPLGRVGGGRTEEHSLTMTAIDSLLKGLDIFSYLTAAVSVVIFNIPHVTLLGYWVSLMDVHHHHHHLQQQQQQQHQTHQQYTKPELVEIDDHDSLGDDIESASTVEVSSEKENENRSYKSSDKGTQENKHTLTTTLGKANTANRKDSHNVTRETCCSSVCPGNGLCKAILIRGLFWASSILFLFLDPTHGCLLLVSQFMLTKYMIKHVLLLEKELTARVGTASSLSSSSSSSAFSALPCTYLTKKAVHILNPNSALKHTSGNGMHHL